MPNISSTCSLLGLILLLGDFRIVALDCLDVML